MILQNKLVCCLKRRSGNFNDDKKFNIYFENDVNIDDFEIFIEDDDSEFVKTDRDFSFVKTNRDFSFFVNDSDFRFVKTNKLILFSKFAKNVSESSFKIDEFFIRFSILIPKSSFGTFHKYRNHFHLK